MTLRFNSGIAEELFDINMLHYLVGNKSRMNIFIYIL